MSARRLWAYEHGTLWMMVLDGTMPAPVASHVATFSEAPPEAAAAIAGAMALEEPSEVRRRFAAGSRCFVAQVEGEIVAYGWVSQGMEQIGELERALRMQSDEAYIWDCATMPGFRRQGLYTALLGYIATVLRNEGMRRLWIGTSLQNRPSLRGMASAGFQPVITVVYFRLLRMRYAWVRGETAAPPAHVADAQRALIDVRKRKRGRRHNG